MLKIQGIDHIVLRTVNPQKMISFYCDILGCTIEKVQPDFGLTHLRAGNNLIDLLEVETPPHALGFNLQHFCLRIATFDYESLKKYFFSKNIVLYQYGERFGAQGQAESFYLKDPEGNEIELVALIN